MDRGTGANQFEGGGGWVGVRGGQGEMDRWMDRQTGPNQFGGEGCVGMRGGGGGAGGDGWTDKQAQTNLLCPFNFFKVGGITMH